MSVAFGACPRRRSIEDICPRWYVWWFTTWRTTTQNGAVFGSALEVLPRELPREAGGVVGGRSARVLSCAARKTRTASAQRRELGDRGQARRVPSGETFGPRVGRPRDVDEGGP